MSSSKRKWRALLWVVVIVAAVCGAQSAYISYTVSRFMSPWESFAENKSTASQVTRSQGEPDFTVREDADLHTWVGHFRPYGSVSIPAKGRVLVYCVTFHGDEAVVYISVDEHDRVQSAVLGA